MGQTLCQWLLGSDEHGKQEQASVAAGSAGDGGPIVSCSSSALIWRGQILHSAQPHTHQHCSGDGLKRHFNALCGTSDLI